MHGRASPGNECDETRHEAGWLWEVVVVILGIILLVVGLIASLSILVWLGVILLIVGLVLNLVPIGGTRRRYY